jgi:aspartyl-tRNA(Asn)/glutamyl-tRNA(Gln) amidotransferase subunit A
VSVSNETAVELGRKLRKGAIDPVELVEQTLTAIAAADDQAIFIDILADRARAEAKAARRRLKAGNAASALDGVPIGWKDLFDIEGRVTKAGSIILKNQPPAKADAALVSAGKRAGLVTVGTLNMTEFAYSGIGLNPHYGTPRNPNGSGPARSPGGSSSASGVVVAKGLLPLAIGTDTGGSIRIPAAFNGVVGYKSSTGHYPMDGVFPLSRTLDTLGPLARSVEDCVAVDAALRGLTRPRARRQFLRELVFFVPENVVFEGVEPAVGENFEAALARLAKGGAKIRRKKLPVFDAILELFQKRGHILSAEALHVHWNRVHGPDAQHMDQRVVRRIKVAEKMSAVDLIEILEQRRRLIAECNEMIGDALVAFPTTPHVAMPIAPLEADQETFFAANAKTLRGTTLGNFLDWCGVAIPSGLGDAGMPTSFLISASHGRDMQMLSAGLTIEELVRG